MSAETLTLEDLRQNPLVQKFASLSPETVALAPEGEEFRIFCLSILSGVHV
ncbi:hypothetical protein ACSAZL_12555 [Methanosarcina sp. T3]|uniref:hypothetical protein n=1 Tax=Methanosarcina sp. T3 TaxID=3439062 RepID=UPI003F84CB04